MSKLCNAIISFMYFQPAIDNEVYFASDIKLIVTLVNSNDAAVPIITYSNIIAFRDNLKM